LAKVWKPPHHTQVYLHLPAYVDTSVVVATKRDVKLERRVPKEEDAE